MKKDETRMSASTAPIAKRESPRADVSGAVAGSRAGSTSVEDNEPRVPRREDRGVSPRRKTVGAALGAGHAAQLVIQHDPREASALVPRRALRPRHQRVIPETRDARVLGILPGPPQDDRL